MLLNIIFAFLLISWASYAIQQIHKLQKEGLESINLYAYESIPTVFTAIGLLGTFIGIFVGLFNFDVSQISESIPPLLDGLKTAFGTSIAGMILSIIFDKYSKKILNQREQDEYGNLNHAKNEIELLTIMINEMREYRKWQKQ